MSKSTHTLAIEYVPIGDLQPNPKNARQHSPAQLRQIARSIESFGFNAPILVDRTNTVIAGHGRLEALKLLKRADAPVIRLEHLTHEQVQAFAIADNRLVETSEWDEAILAEHFKALSELDLDFSLDATGFSMGEIDLMIEGLSEPEPEPEDNETPAEGPAVTRPGDLWRLGDHLLLCGSSLERESYARLMGEERADLVFTDYPYNVPIAGHVSSSGHREFAMASGEMSDAEFDAFMLAACRHLADWSRDGSLHYLFMDWRHVGSLLHVVTAVYDRLVNLCVWSKGQGGMGSFYRSAHELIVVAQKGRKRHVNNVQLGRFGRDRTNVWSYPGANVFGRSGEEADLTREHPTPKPVLLVADAILDASNRGDLVLDPFGGSGSTLLAAQRTGRRCRMIELDPHYCDLIVRRFRRHAGMDGVRVCDGLTFTQAESGQ